MASGKDDIERFVARVVAAEAERIRNAELAELAELRAVVAVQAADLAELARLMAGRASAPPADHGCYACGGAGLQCDQCGWPDGCDCGVGRSSCPNCNGTGLDAARRAEAERAGRGGR